MKAVRNAAIGAALATSGLWSLNANAVTLSPDGIGEAAIAPYYTTRNGWSTLVNLTNVRNAPMLVKVRFHEGNNSRDVLDYIVALSANDVFVGQLDWDGTRNVFNVTDSASTRTGASNGRLTCVIGGASPLPMSSAGVTGSSLAQDQSNPNNNDFGTPRAANVATEAEHQDRLREGYIEFIVMGEFAANFGRGTRDPRTDVISVGRAIENHDCALLNEALGDAVNTTTGAARALETARQAGEGRNALKFNYRLLNQASGIEAGGAATAWVNFFNPATIVTQENAIVPPTAGDARAAGLAGLNANPDANNVASAVGVNQNCARTVGSNRALATVGNLRWAAGIGLNSPNGPAAATFGPLGTNAAGVADPNFARVVPVTVAGSVSNLSCQNLVSRQRTPQFLDPSLNNAFPAIAEYYDPDTNQTYVLQPNVVTDVLAAGTTPNTTVGAPYAATDGAGRPRGVDALALTIQSSGIVNEWTISGTSATNRNFGDWIVTFPTKAFAADLTVSANNLVARGGRQVAVEILDRPDAILDPATAVAGAVNANTLAGTSAYRPFQFRFAGGAATNTTPSVACTGVQTAVYDRAERLILDTDPTLSPAPTLFQRLCFETNVITFQADAGNPNPAPTDATGVFASKLHIQTDNGAPTSINVNALAPNQNGWMRLNLNRTPATNILTVNNITGAASGAAAASLANIIAPAANVSAPGSLQGMPAIGFYVKFRNRGGPDVNFASSLEHARERVATGF